MPWRALLVVVGVVVGSIMLFSFTVGFTSSTAANPATVTHTQVVGSADSIDRTAGLTNAQAVGTPDSVDRISATSTDADLLRCHPNQPC